MSEDLLALFRKTGALLDGHFILRSGLHSRQYFQCAILPALGGIIVGQEVARSLGKRHIFVEKEDGKLVLRRGFQISANEKFVVIEDLSHAADACRRRSISFARTEVWFPQSG